MRCRLLVAALGLLLFADNASATDMPFTETAYVEPASVEAQALSRQAVREESQGDYQALLKTKSDLFLLQNEHEAPTWDVVILSREIESLRRFVLLPKNEQEAFLKAHSYIFDNQYNAYLNSKGFLAAIKENTRTIVRIYGTEYSQYEFVKNIEAAAFAAMSDDRSALTSCDEVEVRYKLTKGIRHPECIRSEYLRSWILKRQGNGDDARRVFLNAIERHKALVRDSRIRGLDSERYRLHSSVLGFLLLSFGRYAESAAILDYQEEAVREVYGERSKSRAVALIDVASAYGLSGELKIAVQKASLSSEIAKSSHLPGDDTYPVILRRYGRLLFEAKNYVLAKETLNAAKREFVASGQTRGQVETLIGLAHIANAMGDDIEADGLCVEALELTENRLADDVELHIDTLKTRAELLQKAGSIQAAIEVISTAIEIQRSSTAGLPDGHPNLARLLEFRSNMLLQSGDVVRARVDLDSALKILLATVGKDHPSTMRLQRQSDIEK